MPLSANLEIYPTDDNAAADNDGRKTKLYYTVSMRRRVCCDIHSVCVFVGGDGEILMG